MLSALARFSAASRNDPSSVSGRARLRHIGDMFNAWRHGVQGPFEKAGRNAEFTLTAVDAVFTVLAGINQSKSHFL